MAAPSIYSARIDVLIVSVPATARSVYELYAKGRSYEELHEQNRGVSRPLWEKYILDTSFKFVVNGYNHTISKTRQRQVIEDFSYMGFMGKIDLQNPEITMGCFEECELKSSLLLRFYSAVLENSCFWRTDPNGHGTAGPKDEGFREVFFGRLVRRGWTRAGLTSFVTESLSRSS